MNLAGIVYRGQLLIQLANINDVESTARAIIETCSRYRDGLITIKNNESFSIPNGIEMEMTISITSKDLPNGDRMPFLIDLRDRLMVINTEVELNLLIITENGIDSILLVDNKYEGKE